MIDLFSLAHIQPSESLERVYRSHPARLFVRLLIAAICVAIPFFFLFDYRGWLWMIAAICWTTGLILLWLAFDVWSSSVVLVTSERVIGAERTAWGRVRIHDWRLSLEHRTPVWQAFTWFPWLGTLTWRHESQVLRLNWARREASAHVQQKTMTLGERRRRLIRLLKKADPVVLEQVERDIDGPDHT